MATSEQKTVASELGKITSSEIWEIPESIRKTLFTKEEAERIRKIAKAIIDSGCVSIYCLGSGTSYHAGLVSTYTFVEVAKFPTHCELAPEFPYLVEPIIAKKHCCICISQSGESELTVYAAEKSKEAGAFIVAITNNPESKLAKVAGDYALITQAGIEKSVLATKTYVAQLVILKALAIDLAMLRGTITKDEHESLWDELKAIPKIIELTLPMMRKEIRKLAPYFKFAKNCFAIGTGPDFANTMEAALKLKEGARIFAQAFSTAEFPHGPITLAESHMAFCIVIVPKREKERRYNDVIKLMQRLKERGVTILAINCNEEKLEDIDFSISIPLVSEIFQPIITIVPIQLLVVEISIIQNINCDTPKYLSKISGI